MSHKSHFFEISFLDLVSELHFKTSLGKVSIKNIQNYGIFHTGGGGVVYPIFITFFFFIETFPKDVLNCNSETPSKNEISKKMPLVWQLT